MVTAAALLGACLVALACLTVMCVACAGRENYTPRSTPLELHLVDDFLTKDEATAISRAALRKGMKRSTVVDEDGPSSTRTSSTAFLGEADDPVVARVFAKVERLLGVPRDRFEDMQVIRYSEGQKYDAHYDPCHGCQEGKRDLLREWTVLMYLNDDFEGGVTDFPLAGKSVAPQTGRAAVFRSMEGDKIVRQSKHQSLPVTAGTKMAATVWVRPK